MVRIRRVNRSGRPAVLLDVTRNRTAPQLLHDRRGNRVLDELPEHLRTA